VVRATRGIWRYLSLHGGHTGIRNERLRFRVKGVSIVAPGDGMLTLRVIRVGVCRKLPIEIRDAHGR